MKKLIVVVLAVVLFSGCTQDVEPEPVLAPSNSMFGVSGERYETDELYNFEVLNSNKGEYLKFKDDAEAHFNMRMDNITSYPDRTYHSYNDGYSYYSIGWYENNNSFIFSWSK